MSEILIVTDLGTFKAYEIVKEPLESPKLELIKAFENIPAYAKVSDIMADQAGRFGVEQSGGGVIKGYGEKHHLEEEIEKRILKTIAEEIENILEEHKPKVWHLATEKTINNKLLELISENTKKILSKNIKANLTKLGKKELLEYLNKS
jgi:hypothetical protein